MDTMFSLLRYLDLLGKIKTESDIGGQLEFTINNSIKLTCEELNRFLFCTKPEVTIDKSKSEKIMESLEPYLSTSLTSN